MAKSVVYVKEYRTLLEKLIESKVRIADCPNIPEEESKRLLMKLDALIDKLIVYFHKSIDRSLDIISEGHYGKKEEEKRYTRTNKITSSGEE